MPTEKNTKKREILTTSVQATLARLSMRMQIVSKAIKNRFFCAPVKAKKPQRILIAHYLLLGDTVLLAPLLKKLSEIFPDSERIILCRKNFLDLFQEKPYGFSALVFDRKIPSTLAAITSSGPYDLAFVLGDNRYSWLARAAGARWIVGFKTDQPSWKNLMLDEQHSPNDGEGTWADRIGQLIDKQSPEPYTLGEWKLPKFGSDIASRVSNYDYAILHLGASTSLRHWPAEHWKVLAQSLIKLGLKVVLSVGPKEDGLLSEFREDEKTLFSRGNLTLGQFATLMGQASVIVSADTGVAHLAKILGVPAVTIFGPGSPIIHGPGTFWKSPQLISVWKENFGCRNQNLLFKRKIFWAQRCGRTVMQCLTPGACMRIVEPDAVLTSVIGRLTFPRKKLMNRDL